MEFKTAQRILEEGAQAHHQSADENLDDAQRGHLLRYAEYCYNQVLEMSSREPMALASIGSLYVERGRWGIGTALLEAAVREAPDDHHALNALGCCYRKTGKTEEAREYLLKALALNPNDAKIMNNLAGSYVNNGEPEKAIEWGQKALKAEPDYRDVLLNMGLAYLEQGDYARGWAAMTAARRKHNRESRNYGPNVKYWDGTKGQTVIVFGEQGVGDEIMFAHCLRDLIRDSKEVIFDCHPRLVNIFRNTFPGMKIFPTRKESVIEWPADVKADAFVAIGALPYFYRNDAASFETHDGYVSADKSLVERYAVPSRGLRVGLSWIGGTKETHMHLRSLPPDVLGPLLTVPGIEWVSLQYTPDAGVMVDAMREKFGCNISHDAEMNADLDKLFGCIAELDLIVTVPTSNVHFAGALGIPAWIAASRKCSWRYARDNMDWYPQHTIYRQHSDDWAPVIEGIARDLAAYARSRRMDAAE